MKPVSFHWKQALLLGLWSFLCVVPVLVKTGPNVVTLTYWEGANRLFQGLSPYAAPSSGVDYFFYPPFFAVFWKAFTFFGELPAVLLWSFFNSFLFWWGISQWVQVQRKQSGWTWFFLVCAAVELDISLRYQQANALLAGLVLWALSEFRYQHFGRAGFLMALGTHLKVFPLILVLGLALPAQWAFFGSYLASAFLLFLVPAGVVGLSESFWLHGEQFQSTTADFSKRDLLDIAACLKRWGFAEWGLALQKVTMLLGGAVLLLYRLRLPNDKFNFRLWYSNVMALLLAVTPKAESPTFVWIAPAYLFLGPMSRGLWRYLWVGLAVFLTLVYSSLFPKSWVAWCTLDYNSKTLANFVLWGVTAALLIREISVKFRRSPVN